MSLFDDAAMREKARQHLERQATREQNHPDAYTEVPGTKPLDSTVRFSADGQVISAPSSSTPPKPHVPTLRHREGESYTVAGVTLARTRFGLSASYASGARVHINDPAKALEVMFDYLAAEAESAKAAEKPSKKGGVK